MTANIQRSGQKPRFLPTEKARCLLTSPQHNPAVQPAETTLFAGGNRAMSAAIAAGDCSQMNCSQIK
jgi:hypothetical protein